MALKSSKKKSPRCVPSGGGVKVRVKKKFLRGVARKPRHSGIPARNAKNFLEPERWKKIAESKPDFFTRQNVFQKPSSGIISSAYGFPRKRSLQRGGTKQAKRAVG